MRTWFADMLHVYHHVRCRFSTFDLRAFDQNSFFFKTSCHIWDLNLWNDQWQNVFQSLFTYWTDPPTVKCFLFLFFFTSQEPGYSRFTTHLALWTVSMDSGVISSSLQLQQANSVICHRWRLTVEFTVNPSFSGHRNHWQIFTFELYWQCSSILEGFSFSGVFKPGCQIYDKAPHHGIEVFCLEHSRLLMFPMTYGEIRIFFLLFLMWICWIILFAIHNDSVW